MPAIFCFKEWSVELSARSFLTPWSEVLKSLTEIPALLPTSCAALWESLHLSASVSSSETREQCLLACTHVCTHWREAGRLK